MIVLCKEFNNFFSSAPAAIHHMDYFNDVFTTFLGLKRGSCIALNAESEEFVFWIWTNVLWIWNDMSQNFHFWVNYPVKKNIQSILISLWEYITSNHIFFEKFCKVCLI